MSQSKIPSILLFGILVASLLPGMGTLPAEAAGGSFGGGTGTSNDPYVIEDAEDLENMSADLDAYYVLGADRGLGLGRWPRAGRDPRPPVPRSP
jgi:hypothetical protein